MRSIDAGGVRAHDNHRRSLLLKANPTATPSAKDSVQSLAHVVSVTMHGGSGRARRRDGV